MTPEERLRKTGELIVDILEMRRRLTGGAEKERGVDGLMEVALAQRSGEEDPFA